MNNTLRKSRCVIVMELPVTILQNKSRFLQTRWRSFLKFEDIMWGHNIDCTAPWKSKKQFNLIKHCSEFGLPFSIHVFYIFQLIFNHSQKNMSLFFRQHSCVEFCSNKNDSLSPQLWDDDLIELLAVRVIIFRPFCARRSSRTRSNIERDPTNFACI